MPITEFLDGYTFDPETRRVMGIAYEMACAAFRLRGDRTEGLKEITAKKIIALAKEGLRDPNLLCEWTLDDLCSSPHGVGHFSFFPEKPVDIGDFS